MNIIKKSVCPVSTEKIPETLPRITAFFVTNLCGIFLVTSFIPIAVFLTFDFFVRGFNYPTLSPLYHISKAIIPLTAETQKHIDKAPKLFAARLGFLVSSLILIFAGFDIRMLSNSLTLLIITLSFLECAFNMCMGCMLYSWIVIPFFKQVK